MVKKFGDDKGGNLTTLLAWNGFFALFPLLLILVTALGFLLSRHPDLEQRVLHSTLAEFPIIGDQLQDNVHSLRANGIALVIGLAGFVWGARGITQAGQHAMAEIWNIPGRQRPSFATRQLRGLLLLLVFGLGVVATTALASLPSLGGHSAAVRARQPGRPGGGQRRAVPGRLPRAHPSSDPHRAAAGGRGRGRGAVHAAAGRRRVPGRPQPQARPAAVWVLRRRARADVMALLDAQVLLYGAEVNVVRARRLWPRSILQPPLTDADQRALIDLARQEERRPEQAINVQFTPQANDPDPDGHPR